MSDARRALFVAVYEALTTDATLTGLVSGRVYDGAPRGAIHPFVSFGAVRSRPIDPDARPAVEHRLDIEVHSRAEGRTEASGIADRVRADLDEAALELIQHALVSLRWTETELARSADSGATRVLVRFRAVTEAV
jgi:hypothetical protein